MSTVPPRLEKDLRALCVLSNVAEPIDFSYLTSFVQKAPDPETAVRQVLTHVPQSSDVLRRKWRNIITDIWSLHHPHVPLLPELNISASELEQAPFLHDAHAVIAALEKQPAKLLQEKQEWLLDPEDVYRLTQLLPSMKDEQVYAVESEWNAMRIRRLRAVLHATRLVRPLRGNLTVVQSRVRRFRSLPLAQQFFILWHADVYHVDWPEFAGLWAKFMHVVQEYLPLLWETTEYAQAEREEDRARWALHVFETFQPLWDDEGLLDVRAGHTAALSIVQQHALPTIIDKFLLQDLLARHGVVRLSEEFGHISKFTWTEVGSKLVGAEAEQKLPCGNDLLDN